MVSNRAVHKEKKEPPTLTPEEIAAHKKFMFQQMRDQVDNVYFKVASKDILAVNRQFAQDIEDEELKIGKQLPCDEIVKENLSQYRPYMNQTASNGEMTPEMFALQQLGMPIAFNHVQGNAKAAAQQ